jgi:hypothetical protein
MKSRPLARKNKYIRLFVGAIILTFVAGWILTGFLGRVAELTYL